MTTVCRMDVVLPVLLTAVLSFAAAWILQARRQQGERTQWVHAQMLDAADEFEKAIYHASAQIGVADAWQTSKPDEAREQLRNVRIAVAEATQRLPRIDLLFGSDSETAQAARDEIGLLGALWHAGEEVLDVKADGADSTEAVERFINASVAAQTMDASFRNNARAAIAKPKLPKKK